MCIVAIITFSQCIQRDILYVCVCMCLVVFCYFYINSSKSNTQLLQNERERSLLFGPKLLYSFSLSQHLKRAEAVANETTFYVYNILTKRKSCKMYDIACSRLDLCVC